MVSPARHIDPHTDYPHPSTSSSRFQDGRVFIAGLHTIRRVVSIRTFSKQGSDTRPATKFLNRDARAPRGSSDSTISVEESATPSPLRSQHPAEPEEPASAHPTKDPHPGGGPSQAILNVTP